MVKIYHQIFVFRFNATVLAYGQTGSGKTYTMGTACSSKDFMAAEPFSLVNLQDELREQ